MSTIAGIGSQARRIPHPGAFGPAKTTPLCSPWDVIQIPGDKAIYIAMAGPHQIWKLDLGLGKSQRLRRIGDREYQGWHRRYRPVSPSRAAWRRMARTCSSPIRRSRESG